MKRALLVACLAMTLQACARDGDSSPSFLGAALLNEEDASQATPSPDPDPILRHVGSNKVLGAMAYQKVTGRTIDPSRLENGR